MGRGFTMRRGGILVDEGGEARKKGRGGITTFATRRNFTSAFRVKRDDRPLCAATTSESDTGTSRNTLDRGNTPRSRWPRRMERVVGRKARNENYKREKSGKKGGRTLVNWVTGKKFGREERKIFVRVRLRTEKWSNWGDYYYNFELIYR